MANLTQAIERTEWNSKREYVGMANPAQVTSIYALAFLALLSAVLYQLYNHLLAEAAHEGLAFLLRSATLGQRSPEARLLVGVATQLENVEEREAVRRTWKRLARPGGDAEVLFFSGERPCDVDEYWRLRRGSCRAWSVHVPVNVNENAALRPYRVQPSMVRPGGAVDGIGFTFKFPVAVSQLGISRKALKLFAERAEERLEATAENRAALQNITVELVNAANSFVELSANFSRYELDSTESNDGFVYLPVDVDVYPRHFEGLLRIRGGMAHSGGLSCNILWHKIFGEDGLLHFTSTLVNGTALPFSPNSCPLVSMTYIVPDIHELRQILGAKDTQNQCQVNKNNNLQPRLVEENEDYADVYHVPGLFDTPSNVPLASLGFLKHAVAKYDFEFIALTNDRTFLAVDQIATRLLSDEGPSEGSWRSTFRNLVKVTRQGEGAEESYHSSHYPILPADTGSVLSRDLAEYLARNADFLRPFSTLSASLGVWLAPLAPQILEEGEWTQENGSCSHATVAYGPVWEKEGMVQCWRNYKKCNKICGCP